MSSENRVPLTVNASWRRADDAVLLGSDDPRMDGWEVEVPKGSHAWTMLRKELLPDPEPGVRPIDDIIEVFASSGASDLAFPSGVRLSSRPFPSSGQTIPLTPRPLVPGIHAGLDLRGVGALGVVDCSGSEESAFVKAIMPKEVSAYVDFTDLNSGELALTNRRDYGTSLALSFIRSNNLHYLVLENFVPAKGVRPVHPGIRYDILRQVESQLGLFTDTGRTLVLCGDSKSITPDVSIELDSERGSFTVGGMLFPWSAEA